jgi:hypothetical protein
MFLFYQLFADFVYQLAPYHPISWGRATLNGFDLCPSFPLEKYSLMKYPFKEQEKPMVEWPLGCRNALPERKFT